jgi:hypothetical protein
MFPRSSRQRTGRLAAGGLLTALTFALACASTTVESMQRMPDRLPRPPVVVVYDFAVSADEAVVDIFGNEFAAGPESAPPASDQAHKVAQALSQAIVAALDQRGIQAVRGTRGDTPPLDALLLKGQFLKIEQGSRLKRMTIGFGAGAPELRVRAQVYQVTAEGLRRVSEGEGAAVGAKTPGMALPVAGGALLGTVATAAVVSGSINLAREVKGAVDDETSQIARELADRARKYYEQQGWL